MAPRTAPAQAGRMSLVALRAFCDLALPRSCAGCGEQGVALCPPCEGELQDALATPAFAARPTPCPAGFPDTCAQAPYDGVVAELLRAFKDAGRGDLGPRLAALLRSSLAGVVIQDESCADAVRAGLPVLVVPMPSRAASVRARGREPTVELARHALRTARPLTLCRALRMSAGGRDQAGLTAGERADNLRGAMRLSATGRARVRGRVCVVVDDIVTTGSSLVEAAATLADGGAAAVVAATVAATQRRGR